MIDTGSHMIAPCGMICSYCYVHHKRKGKCLGCRVVDGNQPKSCRNCKIKDCVLSKGIEFCRQCEDFPCVLMKRLDKSYRTRYNVSLIQFFDSMERDGVEAFLSDLKDKYTCGICGSLINMHDRKCYECDKPK